MISLVKFEPWHARKLQDFGGQETLVAQSKQSDLEMLAAGDAFTAVEDERIIACGGVVAANRFRGVAWGLLQRDNPRTFFGIHRHVVEVLSRQHYAVVVTYVKPTFLPGMRWAPMLGFRLERAYIPFWFPDGTGASEWAYYPDGGRKCRT